MLCEHSVDCVYYKIYKYKTTARQYHLLVASYCEGALQPMCRRRKFQTETGETPPDILCPNGYKAGSHHKIY